jgi:glycosyltransferase involved in cell wall biosynthesis
MTLQPTISVVMAVKNAARYLRTALDSVIAQSYAVSEIILVDGHSTDDTESIARSYPGVRWMQESGHTKPGYAAAWNDGIRAATMDLVALLDSDDHWAPRKIEWQVAALRADPSARCAVGHVQFFLEPGETPPPSFKPSLLERPHVAYMPGALLAWRALFDEVGYFDTAMEIANDIEWFARLKDRRTPVAIVPDVVIHKRVHSRNLSYSAARTPVVNREMIQALRQSIHRQRDPGA